MRRIVIAAIDFALIKGKREANFISADYLYIFGTAVYTYGLSPSIAFDLKDIASELFGYLISDIAFGFWFISPTKRRVVLLLRKIPQAEFEARL